MTSTIRHLACGVAVVALSALSVVSAGCAGDDTATGSESNSGVSWGECPAGQESCTCAAGDACGVGLMCISNVCVDPENASDSTGGSTGGGSGNSASASSTNSTNSTNGSSDSAATPDPTDPGQCGDNSECGDDELCLSSECVWIGVLYFEVRVYSFEPPSCADGWGDAELFYDYYEDDSFVSSSSISACPGEWDDEVLVYDSLLPFELSFWELDAVFDDHLTSLCWGGEECGVIPYSLLRDGEWGGLDGSATYQVFMTFEPIISYG